MHFCHLACARLCRNPKWDSVAKCETTPDCFVFLSPRIVWGRARSRSSACWPPACSRANCTDRRTPSARATRPGSSKTSPAPPRMFAMSTYELLPRCIPLCLSANEQERHVSLANERWCDNLWTFRIIFFFFFNYRFFSFIFAPLIPRPFLYGPHVIARYLKVLKTW